MKIISWNVNGLRSVCKKGFSNFLLSEKPEIICLQEIKVQKEKIPEELLQLKNYYSFFNFAHKKGYSGVAVFCQEKPLQIKTKIGLERFDQEGRFLALEFKSYTLINLYLPHGGRGKENLDYKLAAYRQLIKFLGAHKNNKIVLVGDFNIAHEEIDLARPKQNKNIIMFTPTERKQIDRILKFGFLDSFRIFNQEKGHYTWWCYMADCRKRNIGWRIDYGFVSKNMRGQLKNAFILPEVLGSDHCPIGIEVEPR